MWPNFIWRFMYTWELIYVQSLAIILQGRSSEHYHTLCYSSAGFALDFAYIPQAKLSYRFFLKLRWRLWKAKQAEFLASRANIYSEPRTPGAPSLAQWYGINRRRTVARRCLLFQRRDLPWGRSSQMLYERSSSGCFNSTLKLIRLLQNDEYTRFVPLLEFQI